MTETPSFLTTDDESKDVGGPGRHSSSLPHNTLNDFSSISDTGNPRFAAMHHDANLRALSGSRLFQKV